MTNFVYPFTKISKNEVKIAGGKGASLGEMTRIKIPVPPGFVVLTKAFEYFLEQSDVNIEIDSHFENINYQDVNSVERASAEIRAVIAGKKVPKEVTDEIISAFKKLKCKYVAVRSSATAEDSKAASWAGELESYLFVNQKNLVETVKKCWSSMYTPRAIFYRHEKKLHKKNMSVAVVVQKMVDSEVSGVAFTVHPVTKDRNQMVIEAVYGQGEAIVSGRVTPDTYIIDKKEDYILDINVSEQKKKIAFQKSGGTKEVRIKKSELGRQKLSGKKIIELSQICKKIEKHYRCPQDIEWALFKNKFYILQARPITTL